MRTILVVLSLVLGIVALTSVSAASAIMRETITERTMMQGGRPVTSHIEIGDVPDKLKVATSWARLSKRIYRDAHVALTLNSQELTLSGNGTDYAEVELAFVTPDILHIKPFRVVEGSWLTDDEYLAPRIVLNEAAARIVGNVDQHIQMHWPDVGESVATQIIGTVRDGDPSPIAYVNMNQPGAWRDAAVAENPVSVLFQDANVSPDELHSILASIGAISGMSDSLGEVSRLDTVETLAPELTTTHKLFSIISVIALVIAALGILNIGLSTLAERADELSLRRVFGMRQGEIFFVMLSESLVLATIAGVLGVATSWLLMPYTMHLVGVTTGSIHFPLGAALLGVLAGAITALCGAIIPAIQAMRLPISRIMRDRGSRGFFLGSVSI